MIQPAARFSLADLTAAGVPLRPSDAAALAREVALRTARGELPGIPSPNVIRLDDDGEIHVEGPVASGAEIERGARLLEGLLPAFDAPSDVRVPGALRLVIARALRVLDLPPFESLEAFAEALARFTVDDARTVVRGLAAAFRAAAEPTAEAEAVAAPPPLFPPDAESAELTISDIRRARRATRLTLADISERSRIPVELLREFEWGYLANWPSGFYGRTQVVRYARAAGLDERIVVRVVVPLLQQWDVAPAAASDRREYAAVPPVADVEPEREVNDSPAEELVLAPQPVVVAVPRTHRRKQARWAALLAIPALLAVGLLPGFWITRQADAPTDVPTATAEQSEATPAAVPAAEPTEPPAAREEVAVAQPEQATFRPAQAITNVAFSPSFATAGSAMFYHSGTSRSPGSAIMKADTDAEGAVLRVTKVVDETARNFHARPSPDGMLIAFDSDRDGERGVYVADAEGNNVRRVSGDGFAAVPSWSPDSRKLAFVRAEPNRSRVWNIWMLDLETGAEERVTSHKVGTPWGAAWFPDGKRIAYSHETRLVVRSLDGPQQRSFNSPIRNRLIRTPAVSPDGRRIIFQVHRDGGWLLDVATGRMRKVLADPTAEEFTWSPDGRRVAYHSRRSGKWGVWLLDNATPSSRPTSE